MFAGEGNGGIGREDHVMRPPSTQTLAGGKRLEFLCLLGTETCSYHSLK